MARLQRAELLAGLTDVEGAGLVVHLRHSPRMLRGVDRSTLEVHDQDVNAVLNALRLGGAEAMAISDARRPEVERILVLSAASAKDAGILLNGTFFTPPYRIFAVGDAAAMRLELLREGGVIKKAGLDTLQMVELENVAALRIPASRAAVTFKVARSLPLAAGTFPPPEMMPKVPVASLPTVPEGTLTGAEPGRARPPSNDATQVKPPLPPGGQTGVTPRTKPPARGPASPESVPLSQSYFGGKDLAKFHLAGCRFGERIEKPRRLVFATPEAARKAGRTPCKICLKEQDGD